MGLLDKNYQDQRLTASQKKKIKPAIQGGGYNYLGEQEEVTVPRKWLSDPDHVVAELAYITPREKKVLIDLNMYGSLDGQAKECTWGLQAYKEIWRFCIWSGGGGGDSGDAREQYAVARTTTPVSKPVNVPSISPVERDTGLERIRQENIALANELTNRPFETIKTPIAAANILGNLIGNFGYPVNKDFFQVNVAGKKGYGYGYEDFSQYLQDRGLGKVDAYGNPVSQEREGSGRDAITNIVSQAPYLISDTIPQPSMVNQYFSTLGMGGQTSSSSVPQSGQPLSSSLQTSYNNAKTTINNLLGITPPSQQFGYSAQPYGLLSSTNVTSNPFNIDYLRRLGLI
jgi:hypothetical protein